MFVFSQLFAQNEIIIIKVTIIIKIIVIIIIIIIIIRQKVFLILNSRSDSLK